MPKSSFALRSSGCRGYEVSWHGHDLVVLENAEIRCAVSMTRGAEIIELRDKAVDRDVLWHGHPDIVRNVGGVPSRYRSEGNFLDHFAGGWQEIFPSGGDAPRYLEAPLGQHGEVALLPWEASLVEDSSERIAVRFSVHARTLPVSLERTMTLVAGSSTLLVEGVAHNGSATDIEVMWGHHICLGSPFADPGVRLLLEDGVAVEVPNYDWPGRRWAPGTYRWPRIGRAAGEFELVRELPPEDGSEGHLVFGPLHRGRVRLESPVLGRALTLEFGHEVLAFLWAWMVFGGHPGWPLFGRHRLIALEPFTTPLVTLDRAARDGTALLLAAHGAARTSLSLTFSDTTDPVRNGFPTARSE